jgi:hypothetical protein
LRDDVAFYKDELYESYSRHRLTMRECGGTSHAFVTLRLVYLSYKVAHEHRLAKKILKDHFRFICGSYRQKEILERKEREYLKKKIVDSLGKDAAAVLGSDNERELASGFDD